MFLVFSGICVLMTWLYTIETYNWTFLCASVFLSVFPVYILSSFCSLFIIYTSLFTIKGSKQIQNKRKKN